MPTAADKRHIDKTQIINQQHIKMTFKLPELAYSYDALAPYIDAKTLEIHHSKHHNTYVTKLNAALESTTEFKAPGCVSELISDLSKVPESIRKAVRNNGGGHANHNFFWDILSPKGGGEPVGKLADVIKSQYGSFDAFKEAFAGVANNHFASGWAWLAAKKDGSLGMTSLPGHDSPIMKGDDGLCECSCTPIMVVDVWEHAYYLNYQNRRPDFVSAFWNIVDWEKVLAKYETAIA